jgi:hypothetical protein
MRREIFSILVLASIALIGVLDAYANAFFLYWNFWWFDILMHFLGGFSVGLTSVWLLGIFKRNVLEIVTTKQIFYIAVSTSIIIGVGWEFFEYFSGTYLGEKKIVFDTVLDLIMDTIGGMVASIFINDVVRE